MFTILDKYSKDGISIDDNCYMLRRSFPIKGNRNNVIRELIDAMDSTEIFLILIRSDYIYDEQINKKSTLEDIIYDWFYDRLPYNDNGKLSLYVKEDE